MTKYYYYRVECVSYERMELMKKMVKLFDEIEIAEIEENTIYEDGLWYHGWYVRVRIDVMKYNNETAVFINGFDMEMEEIL